MIQLLKILPSLVNLGTTLLERHDTQEARDFLDRSETKVRELDKKHDGDPEAVTEDFFGGPDSDTS